MVCILMMIPITYPVPSKVNIIIASKRAHVGMHGCAIYVAGDAVAQEGLEIGMHARGVADFARGRSGPCMSSGYYQGHGPHAQNHRALFHARKSSRSTQRSCPAFGRTMQVPIDMQSTELCNRHVRVRLPEPIIS